MVKYVIKFEVTVPSRVTPDVLWRAFNQQVPVLQVEEMVLPVESLEINEKWRQMGRRATYLKKEQGNA